MFLFLAIVLSLALLSFGAVEPEARYGLVLAGSAGLAVWGAARIRRGAAVDVHDVIFAGLAVGCSVLAVSVDAGLALAAMAGVVAWRAAWDSRRRAAAGLASGQAQLVRFLHFLLVVGVMEAVLGLFQYFVAPGWIFGYVNPHYVASGTLINRNHFAGLLGMLAPVAIGLGGFVWMRRQDVARCYVYVLCGSLMGLALMLSLSRMGIFSFVLTLGVLAILSRRAVSRRLGWVLGAAPLAVVTAGIVWIGAGGVVDRYEAVVGADGAVTDLRPAVFMDTLRLIADHPWGVGPGAYGDVFTRYQTAHNDLLIDHAHNDYLETAAEWGVPAAAAFWIFILGVLGVAIRALLRAREPERKGVLLASIGAIVYLLLHSLADFNLQIPSNAMLFAVFVGIALASTASTRARRDGPGAGISRRLNPRWGVLAGALALAAAGLVFVQLRAPFLAAWITRNAAAGPTAYARAAELDPANAAYRFALAQIHHHSPVHRDFEQAREHYQAAIHLNPDRAAYWFELARFREQDGDLSGARGAMERALDRHPNYAEYHWAAANLYVRAGDLPDADFELRRTVDLGPGHLAAVLDLTWRLYEDPAVILHRHVPNTKSANLAALHDFMARGSEAGAALAWDRLRGFEVEVPERFGYIDYLVNLGRHGAAYAVFMGEAEIRSEFPLDVFNGGFEREPMNGGFDWRYASTENARVRRATDVAREGQASLLVEFNGGENIDYAHVWHWLPVRSSGRYELSFWMRTEGISTDEGVYVEVDGRSSPAALGITPWREYRIPFTASSDLVILRVRRNPSQKFDNLLRGRVWLDGFRLAEAGPQS